MKDKKIAILLGSGVSRFSGLMLVNEITDFILNTSNVARDYDMNYYLHSDTVKCQNVKYIQKLLEYLRAIIEEYHKHANIRYEFNYEELYYLLHQISASERKEYENPAIYPLIEKLRNDFGEEVHFYREDFQRFIDEALRYIHYVVYQILQKSNETYSQFEIIAELSKMFNAIDIFTLNHDILIETFFKSKNIEFNFGFEMSGKISFFNRNLLEQKEGINLYKLHGSIDWFSFQDSQGLGNLYCLPLNFDRQIDKYNELDDRLFLTDGLPYFLIGTFNKMLNYLSGVYEIIFDLFKQRILEADKLIISGYGFSDKGINTRISHFISQQAKEIVIIHPNIKQLIASARGSFHINILNNPNVKFVEKKFEESLIDDVL